MAFVAMFMFATSCGSGETEQTTHDEVVTDTVSVDTVLVDTNAIYLEDSSVID